MTDASQPRTATDPEQPTRPEQPAGAASRPSTAATLDTAGDAEVAPDAATVAEAAARRTAMRALGLALPLGALGSALVLFAMGRTWASGTALAAGHEIPVHATGSQTSGFPGALALVGLAALVAVFAVRRAGRFAVSGLLALSGAGTVAVALSRRGDHDAVDSAARAATSLTHATAGHVSGTFWPLLAVTGGLLLLVAGLLALRYGSRWPAMSSRYDRAGASRSESRRSGTPPPIDPDRSEDLWKALDRGEDPTAAAPRQGPR